MELIDQRFQRKYKLKSSKAIESLFKEGIIVKSFPIKMVYLPMNFEDSDFKICVSVPKKIFKKAVDRNRVKRLMREVFRIHKELLMEKFTVSTAVILIYTHTEIISYKEIETHFMKLLAKL